MFKIAIIFLTKIISFAVGAALFLAGVLHLSSPATVVENINQSQATTTAITEESTQTQPANTTNEELSGATASVKEEEQTKINKLQKLVEEAGVLTRQFSALVEQQKKDEPALIPISTSELNQKIRPAVVNIFCTTKTDGALNPISGSGVVVSKEGIILTNAHIGQYFLLKNYQTKNFISCVMRQGDGEKRTFSLDLVYVSPLWIKLHAKDISKQNPTGTGQFDYALLSIGNPVDGSEKPKTFPFIPMETDEKHLVGDSGSVLLASYPAEFLSSSFLERELSLISSVGEVQSIFTFTDESPTVDLLEIDGSILSQKGSSGGAVVNQETGKFVGMITTSTDEKTTGERELRALSSSYVSRVFKKETNAAVTDVLGGNIESFRRAFAEQMIPSLTKQLEIELDK